MAALQYLDNDELPTHWDREALFGLSASSNSDSEDGGDSEVSFNIIDNISQISFKLLDRNISESQYVYYVTVILKFT